MGDVRLPDEHRTVASHYPALLIEDEEGIVIASHFGRPDDELHELGRHEVLVIIQGPHDYVSPSLYAPGDLVPTWNHVTAHLYGTPRSSAEEENYAMLTQLTDHFENGQDHAGICRRTSRAPAERRRALSVCGCASPASTRAPSSARTSHPRCVRYITARFAETNSALRVGDAASQREATVIGL